MSDPVPLNNGDSNGGIAGRAVQAASEAPISVRIIGALALVLLPLGVFAALAATNAYRDFVATRNQVAVTRIDAIDRSIVANFAADFAMLETVLLTGTHETTQDCADMQRAAGFDPRLDGVQRFDARGKPLCGVDVGALPAPVVAGLAALAGKAGQERGFRRAVVVEPGPQPAIWLLVRNNEAGSKAGATAARLQAAALKPLIGETLRGAHNWLTLDHGGERLLDWRPAEGCGPGVACRTVVGDPGLGGLRLTLHQPLTTVSFIQALAILLPLLMWLAALAVGWWAVQRLVVRPVVRMQESVARYTAGDRATRLGGDRYLSREMADLAAGFDAMAEDIGKGEARLRDALAEQKRLTREVHHRVKNNLQIVSSLLSIQSRDAPTPDIAEAYATVQARVGALALVHRWMYDDEAASGVDLRALATDLCASLEQGLAAIHHIAVNLHCDVDRVVVGQDTAVPIAFLITELMSAAARLAVPGPLSARTSALAHGDTVTLSIAADGFKAHDILADTRDPAARIITGMARQLRSPIRRDPGAGCYQIDIALPQHPRTSEVG